MKLQTKTILFYLTLIVPLLIVAGAVTFFLIGKAVQESTDESLWNEKRNAEKLLDTFAVKDKMYLNIDRLSSIQADPGANKGYQFSNEFRPDEDNEEVEFRVLKSYYKTKGVNYLITINRAAIEKDDLMERLSQALLVIALFVLFSFFIVNLLVSKKLWRPFHDTILQLSDYEIKNNSSLNLKPTSTKEFKQLNEAVLKMTDKVYSDFIAQKEFTENASHETQTPLAVIKARLDLLLQSPNLKENEMEQLQVIENSVNKLASLNKALLLLAKIDNHQFKDTDKIDVVAVLNKSLEHFEDSIEAKSIIVKKEIQNDLKLTLNPSLADSLIGNLIQNAVRHNVKGGEINIEVNASGFTIANSGPALNIDAERIFDRFKKNDDSKESLGLGLAIVKRIVGSCGLNINYNYREGLHIFMVSV